MITLKSLFRTSFKLLPRRVPLFNLPRFSFSASPALKEIQEYYDYLKFEELEPKIMKIVYEKANKLHYIGDSDDITSYLTRFLVEHYDKTTPENIFLIANLVKAMHPTGNEDLNSAIKTICFNKKLPLTIELKLLTLVYDSFEDVPFWKEKIEGIIYEQQLDFDSEQTTYIFALVAFFDSSQSDIIALLYDRINEIKLASLSEYALDQLAKAFCFALVKNIESFGTKMEEYVKFVLSEQLKKSPIFLLTSIDLLMYHLSNIVPETDLLRFFLRFKNETKLIFAEKYLLYLIAIKGSYTYPSLYETMKKRQADFGPCFKLPSEEVIGLYVTTNEKLSKVNKLPEKEAERIFSKLQKKIISEIGEEGKDLVRLKMDRSAVEKLVRNVVN